MQDLAFSSRPPSFFTWTAWCETRSRRQRQGIGGYTRFKITSRHIKTMKFLVHSSDCAYNTITKRWVCNLAQRFSNPTQFTLVAGSYRCSTADSYPIAVYLRSEALQKLCKTHHSIELAPHEIISDAFGILRISDSSDVFHLQSRFRFPVHSHLTEQKLDFYFTDNRTLLNGLYTPPLSSGHMLSAVSSKA